MRFSAAAPILTNKDIAARTGLPRPTVSRLTYTLVTLGYLHSLVGFWILYLPGFTVLVALWQALRYRAPPWRLLPAFGWGR